MINKNILNTAARLSRLNKDFFYNKCRIVDKDVYNSKFLFYHYFYWSSDFYNDHYRNLLIDYFDKSEKSYPGSSHMLSVKLCNKIYGVNKEKQNQKTDKNFESILCHLKQLSNKSAYELFESVIHFSGADASIICKSSDNEKIEVSKTCKPVFDFSIDNSFKEIYFKNINKTTKDFFVSILDCYIERESEIFSLVEHAKVNNTPVIIICRGLSDNAKRNLKNILLKNNILVYPYVEKYNNEDPFKMKDFAEMIGAKIVSAESGDNINNSLVEKAVYTKCTISSHDISTNPKNKSLINSINKQITEKEKLDARLTIQ